MPRYRRSPGDNPVDNTWPAVPLVLYDADCGFCTASAGWLGRRKLRTAISPLQRADLAALGVDADRARRQIPFVEPDGAQMGSA